MTHRLQPARTVSALRRAGLAAALSVTTLATFTAVTALTALTLPTAAFAAGGTSGPKVQYQSQGHLGTVIVNPYKIAPLTAIVKNGGYVVKNAKVRVLPKPGGVELAYTVGERQLLTHGGVPVFGLYPNHVNTVEVTFDRVANGKTETFTDTYRIYASAIDMQVSGNSAQTHEMFNVEVKKVDPKYKDRLYFINNIVWASPLTSQVAWNNPMGGALEWGGLPENAIIDTAGDVRWYLRPDAIYDPESVYRGGVMMGFEQNADGTLTWGYGQRYVKYVILGREVFNRRLPPAYVDFSHSLDAAQNGNYFLRVGSAHYKRPDGKSVRTVRDVIVEVDPSGEVVDEWRLWEILDAYRDTVLKAMDQGAVCLNIDLEQSGQTMTDDQLHKMDTSNAFGDITGVGPGRNWAHVNSVDYDPTDDSIILSVRNQSAIVKIGRDKEVKWILASPEGWRDAWAKKVLKPVDAKGNPIECEGSTCKGSFDWTWTQHTAFRADEKSSGDIVYVTAFDNGDARGMEQPALVEEKYSRAVVYKIDQKKMTVEQVWEYGKERGHDWYSPITSLTRYEADKDSIVVYSATPGISGKPSTTHDRVMEIKTHPYLMEFDLGSTTPSVEINFKDTMGYQAMPFDLKRALER